MIMADENLDEVQNLSDLLEELSKLSPEERLKRVRQLQQEKRKRLEELRQKQELEEKSLKQAEELLLKALRELMEEEEKLLREREARRQQERREQEQTLEEALSSTEASPESEVVNVNYGIPETSSQGVSQLNTNIYLTSLEEQQNIYNLARQLAVKARNQELSSEERQELSNILNVVNVQNQYLQSLPENVQRERDPYNYITRIKQVLESAVELQDKMRESYKVRKGHG
ncbi:hypothetical protein J7L02_03950 [Candidatus Woesearchaeota archaeon]|nr:hypothetical protein [Candidatus Woesearchaeota archaeon]